jgi:NTP pyrophosphatase (non-canonical NTP hydrolase)
VTDRPRDRLDAVLEELRAFVRERDWERFHDPKNLVMAVVSEAGELAAEYRWLRSEEADPWTENEERRAVVAAEVADVGIALLMLCDRIGIDFLSAVAAKIERNRHNYPVDASRGRSNRPRSMGKGQ